MTSTGPVPAPLPRPPVAALHALLRSESARPLLTFYDDATGERTELSVKTTENWVAKTANLLAADFATCWGGRVGLVMPLHWQTAVWALAVWSFGVEVVIGQVEDESVQDCDLVVAEEARLADVADVTCADLIGTSLHPLMRRLDRPPTTALDYAEEVLGHGDRFVPTAGSACVLEGRSYGEQALVAAALEHASGWGLEPGGRLLTTLDPSTAEGFLALVVAPLVLGGSVVAVRHADTRRLADRVAAERVTARTP